MRRNDVIQMKTHKPRQHDDVDGHFCGSKTHQLAPPPTRRSNPITIAVQIRRRPRRRSGLDGSGRAADGRRSAADRARRDGINHNGARDGKSRQIVAMDTRISGRDGCARGGAGPARRLPVRELTIRRPGGCGCSCSGYTSPLYQTRAPPLELGSSTKTNSSLFYFENLYSITLSTKRKVSTTMFVTKLDQVLTNLLSPT